MIVRWYLLPLPLLMACGHDAFQSTEELYRKSEELWRRGENRKALELADRGWRQWETKPDSEWHWKFRLLGAELLAAEGLTRSARELLEKTGGQPPAGESQARYVALEALVKHDRALADHALELAQRLEDPALILDAELKRAILDGYSEHSELPLRNVVRIARRQSDKHLQARALAAYGYQRMNQSRFDEAVPFFEQAEALAKQAGADRVRERTLGNLGWCYSRLGDFERALRALTVAIELARQLGDDEGMHRWLNDTGGVYYRRRDFPQAISYYQSAAAAARRVKNETWLTIILNNLSAASVASGDLSAAERFNEQAVALIRKNKDTASLLYSEIHTARIQAARNQTERAEASFRHVIDSSAQKPFVLWEAQAGLARVLQTAGRETEADHEYRAALSTIENEWSKLGEDRHKVTFLAELIRFYGDYIDFLSGRGDTARAVAVADSSRARVLSERLGADLVPGQARKSGAILLSYWIAPARSYLWVIGPKSVQQHILPGEARIAELVNQYAAAIESGRDPIERDNPAARQLYDELLAPARAAIPAGSSVIVVPDGPLHRLNFETLVVTGPAPHYWIEDVTIAVAPALSVLQSPLRRAATPARLLFLGDPTPADPDFPPLPHLKREVDTVRRSFTPAALTVLTREQAYPKAYEAANPGDYALIHFAAHAVANAESPLDSAVILSKNGDDYKLYARDVMAHPLKAELVTISACRGAGAKSYAGEGLLGFTWAFLNAGARNVVASLWEADDAATAELMDEFYSRLTAGSSPAAALRHAKLKLLKAGGRTRPPYYWGAMTLFTRDSELGLPDRNLASAGHAPKSDLIGARLQAGGGK